MPQHDTPGDSPTYIIKCQFMAFDGLKRKKYEKESCNKWRNQIRLNKKDDKLLVSINISIQSGNFKEKESLIPNAKLITGLIWESHYWVNPIKSWRMVHLHKVNKPDCGSKFPFDMEEQPPLNTNFRRGDHSTSSRGSDSMSHLTKRWLALMQMHPSIIVTWQFYLIISIPGAIQQKRRSR